jgi:Flp pilus assembly protein TadD
LKGAQAAFSTARTEVEGAIRDDPNYAEPLSILAMIDAGLGRKEEAIAEGRRAVELLPITKDAINGSLALTHLAIVYAWTGEKEQACKQLDIATKLPGDINYGELLLEPKWGSLRGDPRFEEIVASLAPK